MVMRRKVPARRKKWRGTVVPNREPSAIGCICFVIFIMVLILCILDHAKRNTCLFVGGLILLNIPLMMTRNIRIDYNEEKGFVRRNLLGLRRYFRWRDLTGIREVPARSLRHRNSRQNDTVLEFGKRRVRIGRKAHNRDAFLAVAKKHLKRKEGA